ncbi:hypothetical protein F4861DRAFT_168238 [Xylaria intraflava]|nr:hypothetical protein F4861DRAFT_168238 [Xylaria intraflava]
MHHSRRKPGHVSNNSSTTDVRKAGNTMDPSRPRRPQVVTRKSPSQSLHNLGKNIGDREREYEGEQYLDDDERESFPQFCMTCEKQFVAQDERFLYCSEACRKNDQTATVSSPFLAFEDYGHYHSDSTPLYAWESSETRDIIPRASPSRPSPNNFPPSASPGNPQYTSAITALRSLNLHPPSPPSPLSTNGGIWPFTRSAAASPSSSYTKPDVHPSTYDGGYVASAYNHTDSSMTASDRPLPSRNPPAYSRPKSIALVTPMISRC